MCLTEYDEVRTMNMFREEGRAEGRAEGMEKGRAEGRAEGRTEGVLATLISLVKEGLLSVQQAAARAKLSVGDFERLLSQSEG